MPETKCAFAEGMMKRLLGWMMVLMLMLSMVACGTDESTEEPVTSEKEQEEIQKEIQEETAEETDSKPSGIHDDGMGEDPDFGEGIGEVVALTPEEESYMLAQTTNSWLELSAMEKGDLVALVGRWLEDTTGFIVEDYDELVLMLDHQMEQYYRNGVDEMVLATVRDICGID